jgi:acyl dehydratase
MRSWVGYVAAVAFVAAAHTTVRALQPVFHSASIYTALRELDKQRQSSNAGRDGRFHRIALKITAPGLTWRPRAGYIADRESAAGGDERH